MARHAFSMQVYPGQEEEYRRRHREVHPELLEVLKSKGVRNYSIFLQGQTLFAYMEVDGDVDAVLAEIAQHPAAKRWWKFMEPIMETNEDASPVTRPMEEVFHLD